MRGFCVCVFRVCSKFISFREVSFFRIYGLGAFSFSLKKNDDCVAFVLVCSLGVFFFVVWCDNGNDFSLRSTGLCVQQPKVSGVVTHCFFFVC